MSATRNQSNLVRYADKVANALLDDVADALHVVGSRIGPLTPHWNARTRVTSVPDCEYERLLSLMVKVYRRSVTLSQSLKRPQPSVTSARRRRSTRVAR